MAHSESGADPRTEVAPPAEPATRGPRNGYLLLAVSGVALATVFGGIAQFVTQSKASSGAIGGNDSTGSQQVVPHYSTAPDTDTQTENSTPLSSSSSSSSSAMSSVTIGPDGRPTVTIPSSNSSATVGTQPPRTTGDTTPTGSSSSHSTSNPTTHTPPPDSSTGPTDTPSSPSSSSHGASTSDDGSTRTGYSGTSTSDSTTSTSGSATSTGYSSKR